MTSHHQKYTYSITLDAKRPTESEKSGIKFRRSIYVVEDIELGEKITKEKIRIIRPGKGLAPKYFDEIMGRKVNKNLKKGTALLWNMLK